jgi:hypothetical protein
MGTGAVVHYGSDWIATHWDGDPKNLGKDLQKQITKEVNEAKKHWGKEWNKMKSIVIQGAFHRAVFKTGADHQIDFVSTMGKKDFDKQYGDYGEYEYEIDSNTGKIKFREREGDWSKGKAGAWKKLEKVI